MARIGAWNKIQDENITVNWVNLASGTKLKAFRHPNGDWNVSIKRPKHLYENLLGGKSYKENQSKANALKIARQYMKNHPYK